MRNPTIGTSVVKDICEVLGLTNVRTLDLHFAVDEVVTAIVEFFPEAEDVDKLPAIVKRYELVERETS